MKFTARTFTAVLVALALSAAAAESQAAARKENDKTGQAGSIEARLGALEQATQEKIAALEREVAALKQQLAAVQAAKPAGPSDEDENNASALRAEAQSLMVRGSGEEARAKISELFAKYPQTRAARGAQALRSELEVIGKAAPVKLSVEKWYQGEVEGAKALASKATLLVFWEQWCPHCQREVPRLAQVYAAYKDKGLAVVGLTRLSRNGTDEQVSTFIKERGVPYPMAKETGDLSTYFNVGGIPAAALIKNGKVIWRGHPATLSDEFLSGQL